MSHDLIVIGAGPAGLQAALTGASLGLKTILLDECPQLGGQIYRNIMQVTSGRISPHMAQVLGPDYSHGRLLVQAVIDGGIDGRIELRHGALVWDVARDGTVTALQDGRSFQVQAPQVIAATGAMERASPIPGWTLPGVMNAGAAQIALKGSGLVPDGPVVLAGGGPLLLLVACQLIDAGAQVAAVVETSPASNRRLALPHLPTALGAPEVLAKGLGLIWRLLWRLRRAGVPWFRQATDLVVEGAEHAQGLQFRANGRQQRIAANLVLLHHGVIPNTQMTRLLRLQHDWSDAQLAWQPRADAWGQTSLAGFRIAGDGVAIAGALAAQASGALAALGAAHALHCLGEAQRDQRAAPWREVQGHQARFRPFVDALYRPPEWINAPADDSIVCRCEEVSAGRVREMARLGCQGPNQTKFFSRCGMGPCQGRVCGGVVTQVLAQALGKPPGEVGAYRIRAPLKPVPLSALVALVRTEIVDRAV